MNNDKKLFVSVIIPVFNVKDYVQESINSVISQTYPHLEIIIIDDGSTDGSGKICDDFAKADQRITVIHTENKGLSAARNIGLKTMTGEVVAFLDSDDVFVSDAIETALRSLDEQAADIVSFGYVSLKTEGRLSVQNYDIQNGVSRIPPAGTYGPDESLRLLLQEKKLSIAAWNMLYRSSLWNDISFPEGYVYEDNYTTPVILGKAKKIRAIPDVLIINRRRSGSITRTNTVKNMRDQIRALRFLEAFVSEKTPGVFDKSLTNQMKEDEIAALVYQYSVTDESSYRKQVRQDVLYTASKLDRDEIRFSTWLRILGIKYIPHILLCSVYLFEKLKGLS